MEKIMNVAQYIVDEYKSISGTDIDEMKLHKLLYLSQRESFAIIGQPMFKETFQGWKHGPVNCDVRKCYRQGDFKNAKKDRISTASAYIVRNIIIQYGGYESWKLSELSHNEVSWRNARKGIPDGVNGSVIMKTEDIKKDAEKVRPYDSLYDMYYDEFDDLEVL